MNEATKMRISAELAEKVMGWNRGFIEGMTAYIVLPPTVSIGSPRSIVFPPTDDMPRHERPIQFPWGFDPFNNAEDNRRLRRAACEKGWLLGTQQTASGTYAAWNLDGKHTFSMFSHGDNADLEAVALVLAAVLGIDINEEDEQ